MGPWKIIETYPAEVPETKFKKGKLLKENFGYRICLDGMILEKPFVALDLYFAGLH